MNHFRKTTIFTFFVLLMAFALALFAPSPAKAVITPGGEGVTSSWFDNNDYFEWYLKVYDRNATPTQEIFGERYTAAQTQWVFYAIPSMFLNNIFGWDITSCILNITTDGDFSGCAGTILNRMQSLINPFGYGQHTPDLANKNFIQILASKNMSGIGYISKKILRHPIVPEVKAQDGGFGFNVGAEPVQKLWLAVRNVTYGLLVLITVVFSFMIMFRVKISPQTVITVQSALPKLILTIILITFSYAIAGLLIDFMYIVIGLFSLIISSQGSGISGYDPIKLFGLLTDQNSVLGLLWLYLLFWFIASIATIASLSSSSFGGVLALFVTIVVFFACLFFSFKIVWLTIKTFVNIMLLIVAGPIQILLGAIMPGMGIGAWIKSMLANLMVYPFLGVMFVLAFFFLRQALSYDNAGVGALLDANLFPFDLDRFLSSDAWQPPLSFGQNGVLFLWLMASFGIFAGIPKVADIIKGMIEGKPFAYGTAIGEALQPTSLTGKAGAQVYSNKAQASYEIARKKMLENELPIIPAGTQRSKNVSDILRVLGLVK